VELPRSSGQSVCRDNRATEIDRRSDQFCLGRDLHAWMSIHETIASALDGPLAVTRRDVTMASRSTPDSVRRGHSERLVREHHASSGEAIPDTLRPACLCGRHAEGMRPARVDSRRLHRPDEPLSKESSCIQ
jgi:hypothetical protein